MSKNSSSALYFVELCNIIILSFHVAVTSRSESDSERNIQLWFCFDLIERSLVAEMTVFNLF